MKKNNGLLLLTLLCPFWILFSCSSCTTAKKLTVMSDLTPNESVRGFPKPAPVYHIRVKDNLFVGVYTQDQDLTKPSDPGGGAAAQPSIAFEGVASRSVNGNTVEADGTVNLPMLGKIPVEGMTIEQAEDSIRSVAKQYLKDATIKVRVLNYKVTVLGEVKTPGIYYNFNNYITVFDAIGLAQGTTDYALLKNVLVMRPTPKGTKTYSLDLNSKSTLSSDGYYLLPDDVVILQPGKNKGLQQKLPAIGIVVGSLSALLLLLNYLK
jgi:polysaccharide export outer membrane protein